MHAKQATSMLAAVTAILTAKGAQDEPFYTYRYEADKQYEGNLYLIPTADDPLSLIYITHIEDGGEDETFEVCEGDASHGHILILYPTQHRASTQVYYVVT